MIALHAALIGDVLAGEVDTRKAKAVVASSNVILRTVQLEQQVLGSRAPEKGPLELLPGASGDVTAAEPAALANEKVA